MHFSRDKWLYISIGGFTSGIFLRSLFPASDTSILGTFFVFAFFLCILGVAVFLCTRFLRTRIRYAGLVALFLITAGLGIVRFDVSDLSKGSPVLDALTEKHIVAEGIIVDEPDERETNTRIIVKIDTFPRLEAPPPSGGYKVLVTADLYPQFSYGDRVEISGILKKPSTFTNDGDRIFDYPAYLAKDAIFYQMFYPDIVFVEGGRGNVIKQTLFDVKRAWLTRVSKVIPDPEVSLLGGLVVGAKQSLGEELQEDFRKTGIIHIVVLSGYNVTIVAEAIMRFFSFLPYAASVSVGVLSITFFAIMTGASATIVRASIMALLVLLARATGRTYAITRALFLAGFVMMFHNPKILVFDSSFQLSFMATLGLIYLAPKIEQYFKLVPTKWQFREFATATVATQLFVLPLLLYKMGDLSIVALPVNLLVLGVVPVTMLFGFLTGVVGFLSTTLSLPFAFITHAFLTYQLKVVDLFASIPFASVHIDNFPLWAAVCMYVVYGIGIWNINKKT